MFTQARRKGCLVASGVGNSANFAREVFCERRLFRVLGSPLSPGPMPYTPLDHAAGCGSIHSEFTAL
jgi:hypothetical protein